MGKKGRLSLWTNREIQLRLCLFVVIALAAACVLISIATFYNVWASVLGEVVSSSQPSQEVYELSLQKFIPVNIGLTVLLALLACLGMIILSHKVAGPVYRISKILKELREGKNPEFKLRKGDVLGELLEELKTFVEQERGINQAALRVVEAGRNSQVKDLSLNISLKELENKLGEIRIPEQEKP